MRCDKPMTTKFPFLLGRAFIEAETQQATPSEGRNAFPFLLGRAFIEAQVNEAPEAYMSTFPFLLGRAFIEASHRHLTQN